MKKLILFCAVALATSFTNAQVSWTAQNSAFGNASTGMNSIRIVDNTTAWALGYDASATAANYPSGNYVNSSYYLTNAQTIAGNQSFKSPDGTNETGHTGNGFCRITRKSGKIFVKQNGSWIKV